LGAIRAKRFEAPADGRYRRLEVPLMSKVESRFTGMIPLLARILSMTADGRLRPMVGLDMGYTFRRPRRA